MRWLNFLHCYQPVNAESHIIKEATERSYLRLIRALEEHPQIKFTLNITGCLFLRWDDLGYKDIAPRLKRLLEKGNLELTGSAAYHPFLPLIPEKEVRRQIKENEEILKKYLGANWRGRGFFFPEGAYSPKIAQIVKEFGYEWTVLDEITRNGRLHQLSLDDFDCVYQDKNSGLKVVFRSRKFSKCYVPEFIKKMVKRDRDKDNLYITVTDGELYGLRHIDHTAEFEKLLDNKYLKTMTFSEFVDAHSDFRSVALVASNWESREDELIADKPYALWYDKDNDIQQMLWQLARLAYRITEANQQDKNYQWARWHLVRGLASCTFWWASAKDFRLFGPISWSPDEIERGVNELVRALRALDSETTRAAKLAAERLSIKIKKIIWERHWREYWKK